MRSKQALIIFAKEPIPGRVKTRLAKRIGFKKAAAIYADLLAHTIRQAGLLFDTDIFLFKTVDSAPDYFRDILPRDAMIIDQQGSDLGERMLRAFKEVFAKGYERVVIIGSDCSELMQEHLAQAFDELANNDVVIGPAYDGGYYLLGLVKLYEQLFNNMTWSSSSVYQSTVEKLKNLNIAWTTLEPLADLDY